MTGLSVRVERGEDRDPVTGRRYWRIINLSATPSEYNYWGLLVDGCDGRADALACAAEGGWTVTRSSRRPAKSRPGRVHLRVVR